MRSKRLLSFLLSAVILFGSAALLPEGVFTRNTVIYASADSDGSGIGFKIVEEDSTHPAYCEAVSYDDTYVSDKTQVVIPDYIRGYPVMRAKEGIFNNSEQLKKVALPKTLVEYGSLFKKNQYIETVIIPEGVCRVSPNAFDNCFKLSTVSLPSTLEVICDYAFRGCTSLSSISIPKSVEYIGEYAFSGCSNLIAATIPPKIKEIKRYAFYWCTNLDGKYLKLNNGLTKIGEWAFANCTSLKNVTIPQGVTELEECAFYNCEGLAEVSIPSTLKKVGQFCFYKTPWYTGYKNSSGNMVIIGSTLYEVKPSSQKSFTIPENITFICDYAFYDYSTSNTNYSNITSITLNNKLEEIGSFAFKSTSISNLNIPASVKSISWKKIVPSKTIVTVDANNTSFVIYDNGLYSIDKRVLYHYPSSKKPDNNTLPDELKTISESAFSDNTVMTELTLPKKLTKIQDRAFFNCANLKKLTVPASVSDLYSDSFGKMIDPTNNLITVDGFVCYGYEGSRVQSHCKKYSLPFSSLGTCEHKNTYKEEIQPSADNKNCMKYIDIYTRCSDCGYCKSTRSQTIEDHSFIKEHEYIKAECTKKGWNYHLCRNCGLSEWVKTDPLGHKFSDWEVTKEPTCSEEGTEERMCVRMLNKSMICGKTEKRSINKLPHSFAEKPRWSWSTDQGVSAAACFYCTKCDFESEIKVLNIKCVSYGPDCTNYGGKTYTANVTWNGKVYSDTFRADDKSQTPLGHLWSKANYKWSDDCSSCTAFRICTRDSDHKEIETVKSTSKGNKPTCTESGELTYTAKFKNTTFGTKTKTKVLPATGHSWGTPSWSWNGTKSATAKFVCKNNSKHVQTVKATIKSTTTKPTCTKAGKTVCTATAKFNGKTYTNTKTFTLKALGHSFSAWKTTSFDVDKKTATQKRTCSRGDKTETKTVENAIVRYAGSDRAQTASLISSGMYKTANTVVIATGFDFHDALAAVPLASAYNAPLLLADRDNLSDKTIAEIKRLKAKNVIVVASTNAKDQNGNDAAIKSNVYNQLKELKVKVTKLDGANYYATAKKVADQLKIKTKNAPTSVFITTDKNYADALSASPVAAILGAPILYVDPKAALNATTKNYLASIKKNVKNVYIVGGVNAVSKNVEKSVLSVLGKKSATRFAGDNRYDTCVKINKAFAKTLTGKSVCIAKGYNFPDALAGGVFAAKQKAPLFLADALGGNAELSKTQSSYLKSKNPGKLYIFGGETAVPTQLVKTIAKSCV